MNDADSIIKRNPSIRYCDGCEELYKPTGRFQKYCELCRIERLKQGQEKNRQNAKRKYSTKFKGEEKNGR